MFVSHTCFKNHKELAENLATILRAERQVREKLKQKFEDAETVTRRLNAASQLMEGASLDRSSC